MIIILAYHSISNHKYIYSISPKEFERHLIYLKKKFTLVKLLELENILFGQLSKRDSLANKNLVAVTFDDGLEDNYTQALPILKKLNVPATIFIATDFVGKTYTNASGYTFRFMNWDQIKDTQRSSLVDVQSHTHRHPILTELNDNDIERELVESKVLLETNLGTTVKYLAYPKGKFNDRVKEIAKRHFVLAFGGEGIIDNTTKVDSMSIPRVTVANIPFWKFKLIVSPWYWKIKNLL